MTAADALTLFRVNDDVVVCTSIQGLPNSTKLQRNPLLRRRKNFRAARHRAGLQRTPSGSKTGSNRL